jgi:type I restriction enzyme S subunit
MAKAKTQALTAEERLAQALVPEDERPYDVPGNWVWVRLGFLSTTISKGTTPTGGKNAYVSNGIRFLCVENITENGFIDVSSIMFIDEHTHNNTLKISILKERDVLISIAGTLGRTAIVRFDDLPLNTNQAVAFVRLANDAFSEIYIEKALSSPKIQELLLEQTKVTAIPNLTLEIIKNCPIPLPPLPEQHRIVARIESLFEKLDRAKALVQSALESFETRRAAILHKAFTGELTAKWRETHPCETIDIDAMLEAERETLQRNNSTKKSFKYTPSSKIDLHGRTKGIDELYDIPQTWHWVSLGQLTWSVSDGPHFSPNYVEQGVPMVSARNIKYKHIDFSDAKYVSEEDYREFIKRGKPEVGDVLITKGGTTGIATDVTEDIDFCVWVHVAILKVLKEFVIPEYLRDVLASTTLYRQSQELTHGVGNQDLGLTRMVYMALPLPPKAEQQEIARILDDLLEKEQAAQELTNIIEKIDHMKKAILARAFRGELGTNDPSDESAEELFARTHFEA